MQPLCIEPTVETGARQDESGFLQAVNCVFILHRLSAPTMRLLLVLLALLSGLSLSDVAVAASRAEVVGAATGSTVVVAAEHKACKGERVVEKPTTGTRLASAEPLPRVTHVRACTIRIPDRARE
jgi:hypothetical protein